jgi:hypothetical protein
VAFAKHLLVPRQLTLEISVKRIASNKIVLFITQRRGTVAWWQTWRIK